MASALLSHNIVVVMPGFLFAINTWLLNRLIFHSGRVVCFVIIVGIFITIILILQGQYYVISFSYFDGVS